MDEILSIYKKYNRPVSPRSPKTVLLAKSEEVQTTLKDVQEFISSRTEEQQLKESKHTKQSEGHIVSYSPFNRLQLDIFVLKKYESNNKGCGYIYYVSLIYLAVKFGRIQ